MPADRPLIKGTVVVSTVKMLRVNRDRAAALVPAHLQKYLHDRILVSTWYPEDDAIELARVLAQLLPLPSHVDRWEMMGRMLVRTDLHGVYRAQLRRDDPLGTLNAGISLWRMYHNTGEMKVNPMPGGALVALEGYGILLREVCRLLTGSFFELVEQAGGREVSSVKGHCRLHGHPRCEWRLAWKPPA
jgi:hypothetical protein